MEVICIVNSRNFHQVTVKIFISKKCLLMCNFKNYAVALSVPVVVPSGRVSSDTDCRGRQGLRSSTASIANQWFRELHDICSTCLFGLHNISLTSEGKQPSVPYLGSTILM